MKLSIDGTSQYYGIINFVSDFPISLHLSLSVEGSGMATQYGANVSTWYKFLFDFKGHLHRLHALLSSAGGLENYVFFLLCRFVNS